ncbi:hypothetical protein SteCoe_15407 [Stentor coeruleus]|uniref:Major facilitator superfamily (MFS) profile domain-containing protein n=1 Tax=Stentor coeruleus TaxID=5963 RepID=A0A1R2C3S4_9CILI|nr:hypothetical protein SteCoe_15407 [Stentor coeruleus]
MFMMFYSLGIGALSGFGSNLSLWLAWKRVPVDSQGILAGVGLCGYTLAGTIFGLMMTMLVNENNLPPLSEEINGLREEAYFPEEVYSKVPRAMAILACTYFVMSMVGIWFIYNDDIAEFKSQPNFNLSKLLKQNIFWELFVILWLIYFFFIYFTTTYKNLAFTEIHDDHFITYVASAGMLVNAFAKIFWGKILDKYNWHFTMLILIVGQIFIALIESYSLKSKSFFALVFLAGSFITAPNFLSIMILTNKLFPNDKWVFIYISYAMDLSLASMFLIENYLLPAVGYHATYFGIAFILVLALIIVYVGLIKSDEKKPILNESTE